jgi:hypothetical protein
MPTLAYRITEWKSRYEVTQKGHEADDNTPTEELRQKELEFYRSKVRGHNKGPAYRRLKSKANRFGVGMGSAVYGIFHDLMELASDQRAHFRGWILCEKQKPMTAEDIADHISEDVDVVSRALEILCDPKIGWLQQVEFEISPEIPGIAGNSRQIRVALLSESESEAKAKREVKVKAKEEGFPENPETGSLSPSISSRSSLALASQTSEVRTIDQLEKIFPHRTAADDSTFENIVRQVPPHKHEYLLELALKSKTGDKPIAKFVDLAKRRLGFRGNGGPQ